MKKVKKILTTSLLLSTLALPVISQAAVNKLISAGNGTFYSITSSTSLSGNLKTVDGSSVANAKISLVETQVGPNYKKDNYRASTSYRTNRDLGVKVTNYGTPTPGNGSRNSHTSIQ